MATAQTLEWLQLLATAADRQRSLRLLDDAVAARAGQATQDGFKEFISGLQKKIQ